MSYDYCSVYNAAAFDGEGLLTAAADGIRALLFIPVIPGTLPVSGFVRRMRRRKF